MEPKKVNDAREIAGAIVSEVEALRVRNTPNLRAVRRKYSRILEHAEGKFVLDLAREVHRTCRFRFMAAELVRYHPQAMNLIGEKELAEFGQGIDGWGAVDVFAGLLAGPAWHRGQIPDRLVHKWARSPDRWWRRTALVSTVPLNRRSVGGRGDIPRTLAVCRRLADDHDDMVEKALSWALREIVPHDAKAVRSFLAEHDGVLGARVKREVRNKLSTGLKNPKRKQRRK